MLDGHMLLGMMEVNACTLTKSLCYVADLELNKSSLTITLDAEDKVGSDDVGSVWVNSFKVKGPHVVNLVILGLDSFLPFVTVVASKSFLQAWGVWVIAFNASCEGFSKRE